jgi:hypothetical protein
MLKKYIPHRKDDEKIILVLRRHPFIVTTKLLFWGVVALAPVALYLVLGEVLLPFISNQYIYPIVVLFISTYYLYLWLFAFHTFVDYYLDVWLVTNHRIINVEQKGMLNRIISEQQLDRIQDVTSETKGLFSTLLDYGTVHIQTAGEQARFMFKQIPAPARIAQTVIQLVTQHQAAAETAPTPPPQISQPSN